MPKVGTGGLDPTSWGWDGEGVLGGPTLDPRRADAGAQDGQTSVTATSHLPHCSCRGYGEGTSLSVGRGRPKSRAGARGVAGRH